ncbi:dicarboxylate/amino acid:cation symporter [Clostridium luticellarii]|jgi:Na+/H+-dicarboxylate symporter|uniref:dicarboxylate/amino acid:cation symporter n=1 Tax=Clostridium luticellarii TaxID=1691940 RepID=UPI00235607AD|nr:dicarboxylate/amino acid:cation symporter [Clostridium luticellarii]MCI1945772.1 dicarboxylate/amino acid:cation symporter [Clostridium luticellarii]MCI1968476.1 dicarboxylate/amino acid:cation symporter [Clostridium luticellarii]
MRRILKNYKFTILLLGSIVLGAVVGILGGSKTAVLKPFGDLFLNLMFMIIIPLVFFSVTSAIANMKGMKRLGSIMAGTFLVFIFTALVASIIGFIGALAVNPAEGIDYSTLKKIVADENGAAQQVKQGGILEQLVNTVTVSDFSSLLSKSNMLQLIVFSVLFGISTALLGEKAEPVAKFLAAASEVTMKMVNIVMYYAPIGLGCYFAAVVGSLGSQILQGYLRVFILYIIIALVYYFGVFTLYAFLSGGKRAIGVFWKNAMMPTITALATCSSAATIPVNLKFTKKMGVPEDVAETVIPMGANIHKDGSVIGGVMKITFLFGLFGKNMTSPSSILSIIFVAFLVGAVMAAIPSGGMIGEMLILSIYNFPPELLPIIAVISVIIDAPATVLNSTGNTVSSMMISRLVEGKQWLLSTVKVQDNPGSHK